MSVHKIHIREEAREDFRKARAWYEDQKTGLGEIFLKELEKVLDHISQNPEAFPAQKEKLRQVPLYKFPYVVIYGLAENDLIVYAVFHTHLNPNKKP